MTRRWTVAAFALVSGVDSTARAAEEPASQASGPAGWEIGATFATAKVQANRSSAYNPYREGMIVQLAGRRRLSTYLSLGGLGSVGLLEGNRTFGRIAGDVRGHLVPVPFLDLWADAEVGLALVRTEPMISAFGATGTSAGDRLRAGPVVGAGIGIDLLPVRVFSVGLEGRALRTILGRGEVDHLLTLGLTLTGRFGTL